MSMSDELMQEPSEKQTAENSSISDEHEAKLNELSTDTSTESPSASTLRELARLQLENNALSKKNIRVWSVATILAFGLLIVFYVSMFVFPKTRYVNTSDNTAICSFSPTDGLSISDEDIMDFAKKGILNSYSYDYVNYRDKINDSANAYWTTDGRKVFYTQLDASGNLERVLKGYLIQKTSAIQSPQMEERDKDLTWWIVQIPISIEFYAGGESKPRTTLNYIASVRIVRVPPSKGKKLPVGIDSVNFKS